MRIFLVQADRYSELEQIPVELPAEGFIWLGMTRRGFENHVGVLQAALQRWQAGAMVDLHVADLLNNQLPSHFDYTSWYDLLVFRRLSAGAGSENLFLDDNNGDLSSARRALEAIDTSAVGFAVFDRVLISVHPADCAVREHFANRLQAWATGATLSPVLQGEVRGTARLPGSSADLMLRMVNHLVDSYLDLRRLLTRQLGYLQQQLLDPKSRFDDWTLLLESRNTLNQLEDICEDQRSAVQEWLDALAEWPVETEAEKQRDRELLRLRSRDVLEHVERVLGHVRRLQESAETAVQMHFSALGYRTNEVMRTLTVLTAIFLPLNLISGIFGMNFDFLPLIHHPFGVWLTLGLMVMVALLLIYLFRRKRYLSRPRRD